MISDVIRCSINVFRCSINVFRCSQGALNCPQTFYRHTQMYSRCVRCPKMFKDVFRCSQMFLDVLKLLSWCSQDLSIMFSGCSPDIWSNLNLKVSHGLKVISNDSMEIDDPQVFDNPKGISIGSMDLDDPKVYVDTSIFDGLVVVSVMSWNSIPSINGTSSNNNCE